MYSLIEHSSNYFKTTGSLWFISSGLNFKSFEYNTKLLENTEAQPNPHPANGILKNATIAVPLKLVSAIFIKFLFFHQMIALQKL